MEKTGQRTDGRLIRLKELKSIVGISATSIWRRYKEGNFPVPVHVGPGCVAWHLSEIENWMNSLQAVTPTTVMQVAIGSKRGRKKKIKAVDSELSKVSSKALRGLR